MLSGEKALYVAAAGFGLRLLFFRWVPRLTLATFALLCLPVAVAVLWNTCLLILH